MWVEQNECQRRILTDRGWDRHIIVRHGRQTEVESGEVLEAVGDTHVVDGETRERRDDRRARERR